jgi:lipid-binding SYLF domain-containing protein
MTTRITALVGFVILIATFPGLSAFFRAYAQGPGGNGGTPTIESAGNTLKEVFELSDEIPQVVLDRADCIIVFPSVSKAAFIVGSSDARGVMTCRTGENFNGPWGAPSMMALEAGSLGSQAGGEALDLILLVMNERGAKELLREKAKIGSDASAAAGPVGRNVAAETDVTQRTGILTYSRARGVFAGVSLVGSTLRPDGDANEQVYRKNIPAEEIVLKRAVPPPPSAKLLLSLLESRSPKKMHW